MEMEKIYDLKLLQKHLFYGYWIPNVYVQSNRPFPRIFLSCSCFQFLVLSLELSFVFQINKYYTYLQCLLKCLFNKLGSRGPSGLGKALIMSLILFKNIYVSGFFRHYYLILTWMSSFHMRLSYDIEALNFSMIGSVAPVNLPPHNFFPWKYSLHTSSVKAVSATILDFSYLFVLSIHFLFMFNIVECNKSDTNTISDKTVYAQ